MNKKDRQSTFEKYKGKCAYCGCELLKGWHVDHLEPIRRDLLIRNKLIHPERDCISNYMPSCASCNINKHSETLEGFRAAIKAYMKHLNGINTQYKIAKRYGLIKETDIEVKFYFETIK